ncbi:MAG TPA: glycoside hydrolase family 38 C-terminal domain-containing protein [Pyrinomonadaceae bacterium]|nr:glycoside hydrolase family 38 C-terminal domain-containing protein [Pyrinomonadaceae bacterium]
MKNFNLLHRIFGTVGIALIISPVWVFGQVSTFNTVRTARITGPPFLFDKPDVPPVWSLDSKPTLYLVSNSHIDTQWNWTVQDTIREYVPRTFFDNFKLFEQFPNYKFNFEGVIHYMFFKEYHPEAWTTLQDYVARGRWKLAGSWINAVDPNVPSSESLMRQALYGKRFFRREFGKISRDVYLPDSFGFPYSLPSIAKHSGLISFSTQKLRWGSFIPSPFAVGRWEGVDGSSVVAALRGGNYVQDVRSDVSIDQGWNGDLTHLGNGKKVGFRYFGVGDMGGAPDPTSVQWVERALANTHADARVLNTSADQLAQDLATEDYTALPVYKGELVMKTHGVGCYTSQAAMKNWNRRNEQLADAAERVSVAAEWLGGSPYPREKLRNAWTRVLWHQFHDDVTGTCIPQAYLFSWNDELISLNQFSLITSDATGSIATGLDTRVKGVPLVIYNPLERDRRDVVEATVRFAGQKPRAVRALDPTSGREVPSQVLSSDGNAVKILILADVPAVGFRVFDVRPSVTSGIKSGLAVSERSLENARYRVRLDENGDVASILDKEAGTELLKAPARLELLDDRSVDWPAWEIQWEAVRKPPRAYVAGPQVRIVENGPVRVALEVTRSAEGSTFVQRITLTEGGDRLEFDTRVDWKTPGTLLKASFPMTASNPKATFDLGLGTIERGNAAPNLYEVPAHEWADVTDASGEFGVAILNNSKYGWDKKADNILRLTLIHTPAPDLRPVPAAATRKTFVHQGTNDIGHHHFIYAIAGHKRDWREGQIPTRAARLNQPLIAFQTKMHAGNLGRSFSMLQVSGNQVAVRAFKKAEDSNEIVLRLQELYGRPADGVQVSMPGFIASAREINAAEEAVGNIEIRGGKLVADLKSYQPRSFALTLRPAPQRNRIDAPESESVALPFDTDGVSLDSNRSDGDFDGKGRTIPGELLPAKLELEGITFKFGDSAGTAKNIVTCNGQKIRLPMGDNNRLYILAAAVGGDTTGSFVLQTRDGKSQTTELKVQEWSGVIGQWDSRLVDDHIIREVFITPIPYNGTWAPEVIESQSVLTLTADGKIAGLENLRPAFLKRDDIAWVGTHRHSPAGNEPYILCYLFKYRLDLPKGATSLILPKNYRIRIMAMSAARNANDDTTPAAFLYQ